MKNLNKLQNNETMSSREIAELIGKRHDNIIQAIRTMEPAWAKINGLKIQLVEYVDAKGEKRPMYQLTKTECLYVATKFNDEARARLVLRWEELENKTNPVFDFSNPDIVLKLVENWKKDREEKQILKEHIAIIAPKAEYCDKVLTSVSTYNTTQIAKELGFSAITLNKRLKELKVQYKQGGQWVLCSKHQDKGYTKTKTHTHENNSGLIETSMLTVWTEKGREFIHSLVNVNCSVVKN